MGVPCHPALATSYGLPPLSFYHLSRSAAARLIGNGMCVPCVGSVMHWCAVFCVVDVLDVPRGMCRSDDDVDRRAFVDVSCDLGAGPVDDAHDNVPIFSDVVCASTSSAADTPDVACQESGSIASSTWGVLSALGNALCQHDMSAALAEALRSPTMPLARLRELFPLPAIPADIIATSVSVAREDVESAQEYLLGVIVGLNWMFGFRDRYVVAGRPTSAQCAAYDVILDAALDFHSRLRASFDSRVDGAWSDCEDKGEAPRLKLVASAVAVPDCVATCNPASLIRRELASCDFRCNNHLSECATWP